MKTWKQGIRTELSLLALGFGLLMLAACPNPITPDTYRQLSDKTAPSVSISSPADNSAYTQTVTVSGNAVDEGGQLRSLAYTVTGALGTLTNGSVDMAAIGSDGAFSFQFTTLSFNGPIAVIVSATDWNGNVGQKTITLSSSGNSISSFTVTPSSKSVTLGWESISGATYTVYYTSDGTPPSENYGQVLTISSPPYTLSGITNGVVHTFLLKAHTSSDDYWSGYVKAIPLSQLTLAPMVTGGYRQILLEWSQIDGTDEFIVYRATNADGPYVNYTGITTGTTFTDTLVSDNQWYYYEIQPALAGSIRSTYNGAQTFQIPTVQDRITNVTTPYNAKNVKVVGTYAYVAAGADGLMVVDVGNPRALRYLTTIAMTNAKDLAYANGYLYVADGLGGVRAVDLSVPSAPVVLATYTPGGAFDASAISIAGGQAYVVDSGGGTSIVVLDIGSPPAMTLRCPYVNATYEFFDIDTVVYSPDPNYTFMYITAANMGLSASEVIESWIYLPSNSVTLYAHRDDADYNPDLVCVQGSYVYVLATANSMIEPPPDYILMVYSRYPSTFQEVGRSTDSKGYVADLHVVGTKAYAVDSIGLQTYDVSTPTAPARDEYLNTTGGPTGFDVSGSYGYIASGVRIVQSIDLTAPISLTNAGSWGGSGVGVNGIALRGNYAYLAATGPARLQILDVSTIATPLPRGDALIEGATDVAISGSYAFVAAGSNGLAVVSIANPSSPSVIGTAASASGELTSIAVKGEFAFLAGNKSFQIFDVSDPNNPVWVGIFDSEGMGMHDVALRGRYAYVTDGVYFQPNSLKIIDVSRPATPSLVVRALTSAMVISHVSLFGDWAFVTDTQPGCGLWAVNINPASGSFLQKYGPCETLSGGGGNSIGVAAYGGYAYAIDRTGGLAVINISDPTALADSSLEKTRSLSTTTAEEIVICGKYAFVTDTTNGMKVIKLF
jgi:hypothetical protein